MYNDLKLDNILVGNESLNPKTMDKIRLIDFGFASRYLDSTGRHISQEDVDIFRGNMVFASVNVFAFRTPSRRDDLISLCYLLVYIMKNGDVPFMVDHSMAKSEAYLYLQEVKQRLTPEQLCGPPHSRTWQLLPLVKAAFSLTFEQVPDYKEYRKHLRLCLL